MVTLMVVDDAAGLCVLLSVQDSARAITDDFDDRGSKHRDTHTHKNDDCSSSAAARKLPPPTLLVVIARLWGGV